MQSCDEPVTGLSTFIFLPAKSLVEQPPPQLHRKTDEGTKHALRHRRWRRRTQSQRIEQYSTGKGSKTTAMWVSFCESMPYHLPTTDSMTHHHDMCLEAVLRAVTNPSTVSICWSKDICTETMITMSPPPSVSEQTRPSLVVRSHDSQP